MRRCAWVACLGVLFACGRHEESDAGVTDAGLTAQRFCDAIRDQCAFEVRCGQWVSQERCEQHLALTQADTRTPCERQGAALAWGRVTFDQRAAEHCLEARESCDYGEAARTCDDVFLGAVEPDGGCYAHEDCIKNFYCAGDGTCPGHCAPKKQPGATATSAAECIDDVMYDDLTCSGHLFWGKQCIGYPYDFFTCGPELYCDGPTMRCQRSKKAGSRCGTSESGYNDDCEPGLLCIRQSDAGWECELPRPLDAPCGIDFSGSTNGPCQRGLICRNNTCSLPGAQHAVCYDSRDCDESLQCTTNRRCEPRVPVGEACDGYNLCELSSECRRYGLPDGGYVENFECVPIQLPASDPNSCPVTAR